MNSDKLEGAARGIVGKAQETFGDVTGDGRNQAEGVARNVAGRAQEAYGDVRQSAETAAQEVGRFVEKQPALSLLVAGAIGFALGLMTMSTLSDPPRRRYW